MPALVVIRNGCKHVQYQNNHSTWRRVSPSERLGTSDEEATSYDDDANTLRQAEGTWGCISDKYDKALTERCDVKGMHGYRCAECGNIVADCDDVVSKTFFSHAGKGFLMNNMFNVRVGSARSRHLMTGIYSIADVMCSQCDFVLGWKYLKAVESSQKYKEGKYVLEHAVVQDDSEEQAWNRL